MAYYYDRHPCRQYGCMAFLFDIFMLLLTAALCGFPIWLIWIFVREMRARR